MGEKENKPFQLTFNGFLKVDFRVESILATPFLCSARSLSGDRERRRSVG